LKAVVLINFKLIVFLAFIFVEFIKLASWPNLEREQSLINGFLIYYIQLVDLN